MSKNLKVNSIGEAIVIDNHKIYNFSHVTSYAKGKMKDFNDFVFQTLNPLEINWDDIFVDLDNA